MKTVRVRIAVAVDSSHRWVAAESDTYLRHYMGSLRPDRHVVFVEADVPLPPESVVVRGEVAE